MRDGSMEEQAPFISLAATDMMFLNLLLTLILLVRGTLSVILVNIHTSFVIVSISPASVVTHVQSNLTKIVAVIDVVILHFTK